MKQAVSWLRRRLGWKNMSIRQRLLFPLIVVISCSMLVLGVVTFAFTWEQAVTSADARLADGVSGMVNKMVILWATVDHREYENKVAYELRRQVSSFRSSGWELQQLYITQDSVLPGLEGGQALELSPTDRQEMFSEREGLKKVRAGGRSYRLAYSYLPEENVVVAIGASEADLLRPVVILGLAFLGVTALCIFGAAFASSRLIRFLVNPITQTCAAFQAIQSGDLEQQLHFQDAAAEIASLSDGFNSLVLHLRSLLGRQAATALALREASAVLVQQAAASHQESSDVKQ